MKKIYLRSILFCGAALMPGLPTINAQAAVLPYTADFVKESAEGWTASDNNNDNVTWTAWSNYGVEIQGFLAANDDYISPSFALTSGKTYTLTVTSTGMFDNSTASMQLMAATEDGEFAPIGTLHVPVGANVSDVVSFKAEKSANYRFAIRLLVPQATGYEFPINLTSFAIEQDASATPDPGPDQEQPIGTPIFSDSFDGTIPASEWTAFDWAADGTSYYTYNSESEALPGNMLISPAIRVNADQDYIISYTLKQAAAFDPDVLEVKYGNAATTEAMTTTIATEEIAFTNGTGTYVSQCRFVAPESNYIHLGFHVATETANGTLSLTNVKVTPVSKAIPNPVTGLAAVSDEASSQVTLTWTNPESDTEKTAITGELKANIYENETLVATVDNLEAGKLGTYTYDPENFEGKITYTVKALIGENESEAATCEINLGDYHGEECLLKTFQGITNGNDWYIENVIGLSTWNFYKYGSGESGFEFKFKLGQKAEDDWLISPAIELESGKRYIAKYDLKAGRNDVVGINVTLGNAQTTEAQTTILEKNDPLAVDTKYGGFVSHQCEQFTVPSTGNYNFGFHITHANGPVYMRYLAIYEIVRVVGAEDIDVKEEGLSYNAATQQLMLPQGCTSVKVYNLNGALICSTANAGNTMDLAQLNRGMYVAVATTAAGNTLTAKIVK